jgi:hypothetical protein
VDLIPRPLSCGLAPEFGGVPDLSHLTFDPVEGIDTLTLKTQSVQKLGIPGPIKLTLGPQLLED